jgi:hypothetical protein
MLGGRCRALSGLRPESPSCKVLCSRHKGWDCKPPCQKRGFKQAPPGGSGRNGQKYSMLPDALSWRVLLVLPVQQALVLPGAVKPARWQEAGVPSVSRGLIPPKQGAAGAGVCSHVDAVRHTPSVDSHGSSCSIPAYWQQLRLV